MEHFLSSLTEFSVGKKICIWSNSIMEEKMEKGEVKNEFYSMFDGSVEDVNFILYNQLSDSQKNVILKKWGGNLEHPVKQRGIFSHSENVAYWRVKTRIKELLEIKKESQNKELNKQVNEIGKNRLRTIYEYFDTYTKDEIDKIISTLTPEETELLKLRYGSDLEHPVTSKDFDIVKSGRFYGFLIPKIRRLLLNNNQEKNIKINAEKKVDVSRLEDKPIQEIKYDDNETYLKLYELFRMPYFVQALSRINPRDYLIIFLKLNYPYKTLDEISAFTGVSVEQLKEIYSKGADELKITIDGLIDEALGIASADNEKQYLKKK